MKLRPIDTAPKDGTEILLKTHIGIVSAWTCIKHPTNKSKDDGCYDWSCYDDMFQLELDDASIEGWIPISEVLESGEALKKDVIRIIQDHLNYDIFYSHERVEMRNSRWGQAMTEVKKVIDKYFAKI